MGLNLWNTFLQSGRLCLSITQKQDILNTCYKIAFNLGLGEEAEFSIEWSIFIIIFRWMGVGWEATKLSFLNVPSCWFPNYFNLGFVSWDAEYSWNSGRCDFFETTGGSWSLSNSSTGTIKLIEFESMALLVFIEKWSDLVLYGWVKFGQ